MKKNLIRLMLLLCFFVPSLVNGQDDCNCEPTTESHSLTKPICFFTQFFMDSVCHLYDDDQETCLQMSWDTVGSHSVASVFITVNYEVTTCGESVSIIIRSFRLFDNQRYYDSIYGPSATTCAFNPTDFFSYRDQLLAMLGGLYPSPFEVVYPQSCQSLVQVSWPTGSYIYAPPMDSTPASITPLSLTYELLPCDNSTCCRITYELSSSGHPIVIKTMGPSNCDNSVFIPSPVALNTLDSLGDPITYYGTILEASECAAACGISPSRGYYKSDIANPITNTESQGNTPLEFNVVPTLAHEYIQFSSASEISRIEIYNSQGQLVLTQDKMSSNTLPLGSVQSGTLFIRVYFYKGDSRVIKILKQ